MSKKYRYCKVFSGKTLLKKNNIMALNIRLKTMKNNYQKTGTTLLKICIKAKFLIT